MAGSPRAGIVFALLAIAQWSSLAAVAGSALDGLRPFTLLGPSLLLGGATLLALEVARGRPWRHALGGPPAAFALGLWAIFGYHACLYGALALSPGARVPVNLVNYCWPLCLVVFAGLLERRFRGRAVAGTLLGLAGAVLAIVGGGRLIWPGWAGPLLAAGAAVTWGGFSALQPRVRGAQGRLAGWCCWSGLLALAVAAAVGVGPLPDARGWVVIAYLGAGPLGLAFLCWEAALARVSGQVAGALAYLAPPTSTLLLAWTVGEPLGLAIWVAMALVIAGAALGASGSKSRVRGATSSVAGAPSP